MSAVGIDAQLRELRIRSGNPSIRQIAHLISQQRRNDAMARSTIQDKLTGASTPNLSQVLSLIEAFADHARTVGLPLLPQEIDPGLWRDRVAKLESRSSLEVRKIPSSKTEETVELDWNFDALRHAEMNDLLDLIAESKGAPTASWLPLVIQELKQAEMAYSGLLVTAAEDSLAGLVQTVVALHERFPPARSAWGDYSTPGQPQPDYSISRLLKAAPSKHGGSRAPALVVALRRADLKEYVTIFLAALAEWHAPHNLLRCASSFRAAELKRDADAMLSAVGGARDVTKILEVVDHFELHRANLEKVTVLQGVGASSPYRVLAFARYIEENHPDRAETLYREIAKGIPYGNHAKYAEYAHGSGFQELATIIKHAEFEPPF